MRENAPRKETDDQAEALPFPPKPPIVVPIQGSGQVWTERQKRRWRRKLNMKKREEMRGPKGKGKGFKGNSPPWKRAKKGKAKGEK